MVWLSLVPADGHAGVSGTLCQFGKYRRSESSAAIAGRAISCSPTFARIFFESRRRPLPHHHFLPLQRCHTTAHCEPLLQTRAHDDCPLTFRLFPPFASATRQRLRSPSSSALVFFLSPDLHTFSFTIHIDSVHPRLTNHRWPFDCPRLTSRLIKSSTLFDHPFTHSHPSFIHSLLLLA